MSKEKKIVNGALKRIHIGERLPYSCGSHLDVDISAEIQQELTQLLQRMNETTDASKASGFAMSSRSSSLYVYLLTAFV